MKRGRPTTIIVLNEKERKQLKAIRRSRSLPTSIVRRASIILLAADGMANIEIADKLDVNNSTVGFWRRRFAEKVIGG